MAATKKAKVVKKGADYSLARMQSILRAPPSAPALVWTLDKIYAARDAQRIGRFLYAAQLAEAMRSDDALAVAYKNRLAPQRCIGVDIEPASGRRGDAIAKEAEALYGADGVGLRPDTIADLHGCLANHGIAIGVNEAVVRDDGSRVDIFHRYWPIEHVYWDETRRVLLTRIDGGLDEPIVHGDGRWVVYSNHSYHPWAQDAAVLSAAAVWARHAYGNRDWAKGSQAHGSAKIIGELPENVPLQGPDGEMSADAEAMITLLQDMISSDTPVGIRPSGAKTEFVTNTSSAWQVWKELVGNAEKAAARIYLGTDGILGTQGGAPGVDIESLFGVARTIVEGDLGTIERCLYEGLLVPWTAINFGDSTLAPKRVYRIPDADSDATREALFKRRGFLFDDIARMRGAGFEVTQETVDAMAEGYGVPSIVVPAAKVETGGIVLAPTDHAKVITVNEARASLSLPPLEGPDGELPMATYAEKILAPPAATPAATPPGPAPDPAPGASPPDEAPPPVDVPAALALSALDRLSAAVDRLGSAREPTHVEPLFAARHAAYLADIREMRLQKLNVDDNVLRKLADLHGVPALGVKNVDDDL